MLFLDSTTKTLNNEESINLCYFMFYSSKPVTKYFNTHIGLPKIQKLN